jgi:hypothetical protein
MNELPTEIWSEIVKESKTDVYDKIDNLESISQLTKANRYLQAKLYKKVLDLHGLFKTFDILTYYKNNEQEYALYIYQPDYKNRFINCIPVIPSEFYTFYGKFIPFAQEWGFEKATFDLLDTAEVNVSLYKSKKDIDADRTLIEVNISDTVIYNFSNYYYSNNYVAFTTQPDAYVPSSKVCKYLVCKAIRITRHKIYYSDTRYIDRRYVVKSSPSNVNPDQQLDNYLSELRSVHRRVLQTC